MKFYVKNEFIYQSVRVFPGQVVDIKEALVEHFKGCNVLGDPVKEEVTESATSLSGEKAVTSAKPKRKRKT